MIYLSSDFHFGHQKSFIYEPRGFSSIEEHDKKIIENWNSIVNPEDEVYCLGDCGDRGPDGYRIMTEVLGTSNITYLKGNHEDLFVQAAEALKNYWLDDNILRKEIMEDPYTYIISYSSSLRTSSQ